MSEIRAAVSVDKDSGRYRTKNIEYKSIRDVTRVEISTIEVVWSGVEIRIGVYYTGGS